MSHNDQKRSMSFHRRLKLRMAAAEGTCFALGQIIVSFQQLEHRIAEITGYLLSESDVQLGIIVTSELSFRGLLNLAYSLAQHRGMEPRRLESLREILGDCAAAEQRRNSLMHSYWEPEPETLQVTRFKYTAKYPRGYRHQLETLTEAGLIKVAVDFATLALDLTELMDAHDRTWSAHSSIRGNMDVTSSLLPDRLKAECERVRVSRKS